MKKKQTKPLSKKNTLKSRTGHMIRCCHESNKLFMIGGYNSERIFTDIWEASPVKLNWIELKGDHHPLNRMEFSCDIIDGCLYLFGGISIDGNEVSVFNDLWKIDLRLKTPRWIEISSETPISERSGHVAISINSSYLLVHGGECMGSLNDTWLFDPTRNNWTQIAQTARLPPPRSFHSAVFCPESSLVVIFGGVSRVPESEGEEQPNLVPVHLNDMWILRTHNPDPSAWIWEEVRCPGLAPSPRENSLLLSLPLSHSSSSSASTSQKVVLFGGFGLVETFENNEEEEEEEEEEQEQTKESEGLKVEHQNAEEPVGEVIADEVIACREGLSGLALSSESVGDEVFSRRAVDSTSSSSSSVPLESEPHDNSEEDDEEEEEDVALGMLDDLWVIDLVSGEAVEMEMELKGGGGGGGEVVACKGAQGLISRELEKEGKGKDTESETDSSPASFSSPLSVYLFGGFDGEAYLGARTLTLPPPSEEIEK